MVLHGVRRAIAVAVFLLVACEGDATPPPGPGVKRVFVTSGRYTGNLGGLSGGDAKCAAAAGAARLGGNWTAWLSDANLDAVDRIPDESPWYLVDGTTLAFQFKADLTDLPKHPINRDENGTLVPQFQRVWTGTEYGGMGMPDNHCQGWTIGTAAADALVGFVAITAWTDEAIVSCASTLRLYCFER